MDVRLFVKVYVGLVLSVASGTKSTSLHPNLPKRNVTWSPRLVGPQFDLFSYPMFEDSIFLGFRSQSIHNGIFDSFDSNLSSGANTVATTTAVATIITGLADDTTVENQYNVLLLLVSYITCNNRQ